MSAAGRYWVMTGAPPLRVQLLGQQRCASGMTWRHPAAAAAAAPPARKPRAPQRKPTERAMQLLDLMESIAAAGGALPAPIDIGRALGLPDPTHGHSVILHALIALERRGRVRFWKDPAWPGALAVKVGDRVLRTPRTPAWVTL